MAMKQYYPIEEDTLENLIARRRRLGISYLAVDREIKKREAEEKAKLKEEPEHWWSKMSWKR